MRFLDPACGSGSFLIQAYQHLLNWHLAWYSENGIEKHTKGKRPVLVKDRKGSVRLSIDERKKILLNNIFGVDIDFQAVEVTKLSLLLKVLEGEDDLTMQQLGIFKERALPDLGKNIKCGNSLIGPDYYENVQMNLNDEDEILRVNVFDWNSEFAEIMGNGGFDAVIGNPPYGDYFNKYEKDYFLNKFSNSFSGTFDSYIIFFSLALKVLRNKGRLSFITPQTFLNYSQFSGLRSLLLKDNSILSLIQIKNAFGDAIVDNVIIVLTKSLPHQPLMVGIFKEKISSIDEKKLERIPFSYLTSQSFIIKTSEKFDIHKLLLNSIRLGEYVKITQGITTGGNSCFIGRKNDFIKNGIDEFLLKKTLKGKNIDRYKIEFTEEYILYSTRYLEEKHQNSISKFLKPYEITLSKKRETQQGKLPWYCLHWSRNENDFKENKILIRQTASRIIAVIDEECYYPIDSIHTLNVIKDNNSNLLRYILGILNSNLFKYLYHMKMDEDGKVYPQIKKVNIEWLPIKNISVDKYCYSQIVNHVNQLIELNKKNIEANTPQMQDILKRQIETTDRQIDKLVYKLYGLTDEEIKTVEAG